MPFEDKFGGQRNKAVFKVRAVVLDAARSWLNEQGFVEVQGPVLLPAVGERPRGFRVDYFGKGAFLSGGLQPYSDVFVEMFGKIYTVAPTFRAEPLKDNKHLTEFWRVEVASSGLDLDGIIRVEEEIVARICRLLCEKVADELCFLHGSVESLKQVRTPFPRVTYDKAIERLQEVGCRVNWANR